jgi:hypothetical protein
MTRRAVLQVMAGSATAARTLTEKEVVAEAMRSPRFRMDYIAVPGTSQRVLGCVSLPGRTFRRVPDTERFRIS